MSKTYLCVIGKILCITVLLSAFVILMPATAFSKVVSIDAQADVSVALNDNGTVFMWGDTRDGTFRSDEPVLVDITNITAASAGVFNALFLKDDGTVWAIGDNEYGQLGDGTRVDSSKAVQVQCLSEVVAISAGDCHNLALKRDGTVWAWGCNLFGQIGNDNVGHDELTPVQVPGLSGVKEISAGYMGSKAITGDGTVWAWGINEYGQIGDGTKEIRSLPVRISINNVSAIDTGEYGTSIALKSDGSVWTWGNNGQGQLGDPAEDTLSMMLPVSNLGSERLVPGKTGGLYNVTSVSAGARNSLAVKDDGTLWVWGENQEGRFGNGLKFGRDSIRPVIVPGLNNIVSVKAGASYMLALSDDGTVYGWGKNIFGAVGNGERSETVVKPLIVIKGTVDSQDSNTTELPVTEDKLSVDSNDGSSQSQPDLNLGLAGMAVFIVTVLLGIVILIRTRK